MAKGATSVVGEPAVLSERDAGSYLLLHKVKTVILFHFPSHSFPFSYIIFSHANG